MNLGRKIHRRITAASRILALALLVCALLAPKISLAIAVAFGTGYSSVVFCTGDGLKRVTVAPSGEVVEDVSDSWASPHCVLPDARTGELQRHWQQVSYPQFKSIATLSETQSVRPPCSVRPAVLGRGPPLSC